MTCCDNTYKLGCFNHCSTIKFGTADATKTLTGIFTFAGSSYPLAIPIVTGQQYSIPLSGLNENAEYTLKLYNSDGTIYTITINDVEYDCFSLKTMVVYDSTSTTTSEETVCCDPLIIHVTEESYVLTVSQWSSYGAIPELQVVVMIDGVYQNIDFQQTYDSMPTPTEITINAFGATDWYLIVS